MNPKQVMAHAGTDGGGTTRSFAYLWFANSQRILVAAGVVVAFGFGYLTGHASPPAPTQGVHAYSSFFVRGLCHAPAEDAFPVDCDYHNGAWWPLANTR
jgi:hypothetical protein